MTATLTEDSYVTLEELFGQEDEMEMISAIHIRPEPTYWVQRSLGEYDQRNRVTEIVRHAPRPFLLYVSTREDVRVWCDNLLNIGIRRIAGVHGGTQNRDLIVEAWQSGEIDAVVATSAFGLGMDQSHVRTVIHACVPETVDRFYQEVGRAGRDGRACASFLVYKDKDFQVAKTLSTRKSITVKQGIKRWRKMFANTEKGRNFLRVDLRAQPPRVRKDSKTNFEWNLKTLILMSRAGLISLESEPPPRIENWENESEKEINERFEEYFNSRTIRVIASGHQDKDMWEDRVEPVRKTIFDTGRAALNLMEQILEGKRETSQILASVYAIRRYGIKPVPVCGGCEVCRKNRWDLSDYEVPIPQPIRKPDDRFEPKLLQILGSDASFRLVSYSSPPDSHGLDKLNKRILKFLGDCVNLGIKEVAVARHWLNNREYRALYKKAPNRMVIHTDLLREHLELVSLRLPRITVLDQDKSFQAIPDYLFAVDRPLHIILFSEETREASPPFKKVVDVWDHVSLETIMEKLNQ